MKNLFRSLSVSSVIALSSTVFCAFAAPISTLNQQKSSQMALNQSMITSPSAATCQDSQLRMPVAGDVVAVMETDLGTIKIRLFTKGVPKLTKNFIKLVEAGKYDGTPVHRVVKDFIIQGGDFTNRDGTGGYSYKGPNTFLPNEINPCYHHLYGTLSMAKTSDPVSIGSQFFIVTNKDGTPFLDGNYSPIGQVYEGMDIVDQIQNLQVPGTEQPTKIINVKKVTISTIPELSGQVALSSDVFAASPQSINLLHSQISTQPILTTFRSEESNAEPTNESPCSDQRRLISSGTSYPQEIIDTLLKEQWNTAPATKTLDYVNEDKGISVKLPYNDCWGSKNYRISPYENNVDPEDYLQFGSINICPEGGSCLAREYSLSFVSPQPLDEALRQIKACSPDRQTKVMTIGDLSVIQYDDPLGLCSAGGFIVIGQKANYIFGGTCLSDANMEELKTVIASMKLF